MAASRRFLADVMLGRLARWLRVAGEDVATVAAGRVADGMLLERARREGRIVLTRDRRFPGAPGERHVLMSTDLDEQLVEVYRAFPADPLARAWTRCTVCNAPVAAVARSAILERLPPRVREHGSGFRRCTGCGHLFWEGTHTARLRARLERVRARLVLPGASGDAITAPAAPAARAAGAAPAARAAHARVAPSRATSRVRDDLDRQLRALFARHGFSWRGYRRVRRRLRAPLAARAAELGLAGIDAYVERAASDPREERELNALLAISVSRFFRDRVDWLRLRRAAFPALVAAAGSGPVRALCLGCASGEEPYTLRMLWEAWARCVDGPRLEILAADVRADLLARARRALYPPSSIHSMPAALVERHFVRDGEMLRLDPAIVRSIGFVRLDLYDGALPGPVELVLCRNSAFTYLGPGRLARLVDRLCAAVVDGGFLMVGGNEGVVVPEGFERHGRCLFRRTNATSRPAS